MQIGGYRIRIIGVSALVDVLRKKGRRKPKFEKIPEDLPEDVMEKWKEIAESSNGEDV